MEWYEYHKKLYESSLSNFDYLSILENNYDRVVKRDITLLKDVILNHDIVIKDNIDKLKTLFIQNKLVTSRLGNVESRFLIKNLFDKNIPGDYENLKNKDDDFRMKKNAGLYYQNAEDKIKVHNWWCYSTLKLLLDNRTTLTSCYVHLPYDLSLLASLNIQNRYLINFSTIVNIIQWFQNKKVLLLSNGVDSMRKSYNLGLQRAYNLHIPEFELYTIKTPQTTTNMPYPHKTSIETTDSILQEIILNYPDFDIALLACGCYGPPLQLKLLETFGNRNMVYLGSMLYTMFGLYTHNLLKPSVSDGRFISDNFIEVEEKCPEVCKNIDKGKYWSI